MTTPVTPRLLSWTPRSPDGAAGLYDHTYCSSPSCKRSSLPQMLCRAVGCWRCQLLCLPHLLVCLSECWQREASAFLSLSTLVRRVYKPRAQSTQSAVPQASGYASRTGAFRDQAKGTEGPLRPGHYSYRTHICAKNWPSPYLVEWIWC